MRCCDSSSRYVTREPAVYGGFQRRIERLLDEADEAVSKLAWEVVRDRAQAGLAFEPENEDASFLLTAADRALSGSAHHYRSLRKQARAA